MKTKFRKPQIKHRMLLQIATEKIVRLEGNLNYTSFILQTGKRELMSYTLGMYTKILPDGFVRVSKSCIVNKKFVESVDEIEKKVVLIDKTELLVSRRRWNFVIQNIAA